MYAYLISCLFLRYTPYSSNIEYPQYLRVYMCHLLTIYMHMKQHTSNRMYQEFTRNVPGMCQECARNPPGILVWNQESTRNPGIEPGIYQEFTRNPGIEPGLPGILQEYVGQWKVLIGIRVMVKEKMFFQTPLMRLRLLIDYIIDLYMVLTLSKCPNVPIRPDESEASRDQR